MTQNNIESINGRTDEWKDGWTDGWKDGRTEGWMEGWMNGRTDGWIDGWMDGRSSDGWKDGRTNERMEELMDGRTDGHSYPIYKVIPEKWLKINLAFLTFFQKLKKRANSVGIFWRRVILFLTVWLNPTCYWSVKNAFCFPNHFWMQMWDRLFNKLGEISWTTNSGCENRTY